jgi:hypothetical protein
MFLGIEGNLMEAECRRNRMVKKHRENREAAERVEKWDAYTWSARA